MACGSTANARASDASRPQDSPWLRQQAAADGEENGATAEEVGVHCSGLVVLMSAWFVMESDA